MKTSLKLIAEERFRQIDKKGYDALRDKVHVKGELIKAAVMYALDVIKPGFSNDDKVVNWPWSPQWWKPTPDDKVRQLTKAAALIAAEIDRIQGTGA